MNEQESHSSDYLRPPLWHGKFAFGKVSLRLTLQKRDSGEKSTQRFKQASLFALDEPSDEKSPVILRRLLVLGLYLSFLACLTGLWLTANANSNLEHKLPAGITNFIATQPLIVLLVPLLLLIGCYFLLRLMTYEIIAWPERFLDERQQIVRDKAHRNAYKVVKVACLLVPLYLCLHAILWNAQTPASVPVTAPVPAPAPVFTVVHPTEYILFVTEGPGVQDVHIIQTNPKLQQAGVIVLYEALSPQNLLLSGNNVSFTINAKHIITYFSYMGIFDPVQPIHAIHTQETPSHVQAPVTRTFSWPDTTTSLFLYYGALLLALLLMALALPMSLVAWKERL